MEFRLPHILRLYNVFRENKDSENCAQLLVEEFIKMLNVSSFNDEHDRNIVSINSLNIHDANDMQDHKLGDAMFDEDDIFCPPSFDEQIYYDDYGDDMYAIISNDNHETCHNDLNFQFGYDNQVSHDSYFVEFSPTTMNEKEFAYVKSNKFSMLEDHERIALCDSYLAEFPHDATENYYDGGTYACRNCNNIKFPPYVFKVSKACFAFLC